MKNIILLLLFPFMLFSSTNMFTNSEVFIDQKLSYTIENIGDANFKSFESLGTKKSI